MEKENNMLNSYNLLPIDLIKLNKEKLVEIYNCSDLDALEYMYEFCKGDLKELCERLIDINMNTDIGWGREPHTVEESDEYYDGKWKLLNYFGIKNNNGDACL